MSVALAFPLGYGGILGLLFVLRYRHGSERYLPKENVIDIAKLLLKAIENQIEQQNIKSKFYQAVLALLYLLRFRKTDPTFLLPGSDEAKAFVARIERIAEDGVGHVEEPKRERKIIEATEAIKNYIDYKPDYSVIVTFAEEADQERD